MNKADSERILGLLETIGYKKTSNEKEAELLIINTCTIRASAEDKAFSYLGVWGKRKRSNPNLTIAVCGCVAQQKKEAVLKQAPFVDIVFGTQNIDELPEIIEKFNKDKLSQCCIRSKPYEIIKENILPIRDSKLTAWVNIIEGCDYFCTYCVVPYVRGRQRSRLPEDIIKEIIQLADSGYKEVTLLGQTVDSYGKDLNDPGISLPNLLEELNKIQNLKRIRFVTSHPNDITEELIEKVSILDKVCEYFHIPMQSGNTEILQKMRRDYSAEKYYALVHNIRNKVKNVGITSDFIVAFPGETEEHFEDTIKAVDELVFDQCNTAMYSPRKQTPGATWKTIQLPQSVKKERINILNSHVKKAALKSNIKYIDTNQEILVESFKEKDKDIILTGRTRNNKLTHFKGSIDLVGEIVAVKITDASAWSLKGDL